VRFPVLSFLPFPLETNQQPTCSDTTGAATSRQFAQPPPPSSDMSSCRSTTGTERPRYKMPDVPPIATGSGQCRPIADSIAGGLDKKRRCKKRGLPADNEYEPKTSKRKR
jgi:hypothetical protein